MAAWVGKFKLTESDKFDEFLKELGVGMIKRKLATSTKPELEISQEGPQWTIKTKTAIRDSVITFKLGEQFDEDRQDDVKVKSTVTLSADEKTLTHVQEADKTVTIVRELGDKGIKTVATVNNVSSTRFYERA